MPAGAAKSSARALYHRARRGTLTPAAKSLLQHLNPDMDLSAANEHATTGRSRAEQWAGTLDGAAHWVEAHNKQMPRTHGPNHTDEERFYGTWLSNQRAKVQPGSERFQELCKRIPGWNATAVTEQGWAATARELETWVKAHGRRPHQSKDPERAVENRFAGWLINQRRSTKITDKRLTHLEAIVPGWSRTPQKRARR